MRFLLWSLIFVLGQSVDHSASAQSNDFELVQPESYVVRRFAEVVASQVEEIKSLDRAEKLIELRALLAVTTRRLEQIQSLGNSKSSEELSLSLTYENSIRAARALRDHYQKKLERLETSARRKK